MQLIFKRSKFLITAVFSCILFMELFVGNREITDFSTTHTQQYSHVQSGASIWNSMSGSFVLDHREGSREVQAEIRKLLMDPAKLYRILTAAGYYIYFIHHQTIARGLPAEIALIPVIESEYNPNDRSKKGASGLWQLMPQTAHDLGVKVQSDYDGRRNVVASTKAALAYFKDLGNDFNGNWYLAIAAYNCGQFKVKHVVKRTGIQSFWQLPLPKETKEYVPKLLAVAAIVKNPEKYGVALPPVNDKLYFTELKMKKRVNLKQVSQSSGIDLKTLRALNPDYKTGPVPHKDGYTTLLVPADKLSSVRQI